MSPLLPTPSSLLLISLLAFIQIDMGSCRGRAATAGKAFWSSLLVWKTTLLLPVFDCLSYLKEGSGDRSYPHELLWSLDIVQKIRWAKGGPEMFTSCVDDNDNSDDDIDGYNNNDDDDDDDNDNDDHCDNNDDADVHFNKW
jgi:hypothetical protein